MLTCEQVLESLKIQIVTKNFGLMKHVQHVYKKRLILLERES